MIYGPTIMSSELDCPTDPILTFHESKHNTYLSNKTDPDTSQTSYFIITKHASIALQAMTSDATLYSFSTYYPFQIHTKSKHVQVVHSQSLLFCLLMSHSQSLHRVYFKCNSYIQIIIYRITILWSF